MSSYAFALIQLLIGLFMLIGLRIAISSNVIARADRFNIVTYVYNRCNAAGLEYTQDAIPRLIVIALVVSAIGGFLFSPMMAVVLPIVSAGSFVIFTFVRQRYLEQNSGRINDELCFFIARSLRAGQPLENAIAAAFDQFSNSPLLTHVIGHIRAGSTLAQSVSHNEIKKLSLNTSEAMLCATIALANNMGGNSARVFERIGDSFHQEYELHHDTVASLSQVKTSAIVISCLPIGMFVLTLMSGGDSALFLFTHPVGWICLMLGFTLQLLGAMWMRRLVQKGVGIWTS